MSSFYTLIGWKVRKGSFLNRFTKQNETDTSVELINNPVITEDGTPLSVENLAHMDDGIESAHNRIDSVVETVNQKLDSSSYTPNDVLAKILEVDGPTSGISVTDSKNSDKLDGVHIKTISITTTLTASSLSEVGKKAHGIASGRSKILCAFCKYSNYLDTLYAQCCPPNGYKDGTGALLGLTVAWDDANILLIHKAGESFGENAGAAVNLKYTILYTD